MRLIVFTITLALTWIGTESTCEAGEKADGKGTPAVNYTKLARSLVRYPNNPVIKVGEKGAWDDQTLGCFTVLDDGSTFYFYSGGARYGKPKNTGMATSADGIHWTEYGNNPLFPGGMPYAMAPLPDDELADLVAWVRAGAPASPAGPGIPTAVAVEVARWERFLNRPDPASRLVSRYLYEHWFLGHLTFTDAGGSPFFRVVRSRTAPGEPIDVIATRRPYDDPGVERFWYRLRPIESTIVHKTHIVYPLDAERLARLDALLISSMLSRAGASGKSSSNARSALPRIAIRILLKSWAMPPASVPRLSSFCACCIWRSRLSRSSSDLAARTTSEAVPATVCNTASSSQESGRLLKRARTPIGASSCDSSR